MIVIRSKREIERMLKAGRIVAGCHKELDRQIKPGISTMEIDRFVEDYLRHHGATAAQKGYKGYQYATCASINDEICHGFPRNEPLNEGDIVTIDFVADLDGWMADSAWSYAVGNVSSEAEKLLDVTENALYKGIEQAIIGNRLGDIGHAIQSYVEPLGFSVVRDFVGHGIGQKIHDDPVVRHFGQSGRGIRLREGMVFTIEPMINVGTYACSFDANGWTARTKDGKLSTQFEHTLAITKDGPLIITDQRNL